MQNIWFGVKYDLDMFFFAALMRFTHTILNTKWKWRCVTLLTSRYSNGGRSRGWDQNEQWTDFYSSDTGCLRGRLNRTHSCFNNS